MATRLHDLHHIPHELKGLPGQVDTILWIAVLEHTGQTGHRAAQGHIPVGAPNDVLRLLTEAPLLGAAVALIPNSGAPPDPSSPLEGVGGSGELPPVDEHTHWCSGLTQLPSLIQPLCRPAGPGTLVLGIPLERRGRILSHAGILGCSGLVFLRLSASPGGVRRVGDDGIEGAGGKALQHLQGVSLDDLPFIAHGHLSLSFYWISGGWEAVSAPSPHTR